MNIHWPRVLAKAALRAIAGYKVVSFIDFADTKDLITGFTATKKRCKQIYVAIYVVDGKKREKRV